MSVHCSSSTGRTTRSSELLSSKMFVKGAPEGIIERCTKVRVGKETVQLTNEMKEKILEQVTVYGTGMCSLCQSCCSIYDICSTFCVGLIENVSKQLYSFGVISIMCYID